MMKREKKVKKEKGEGDLFCGLGGWEATDRVRFCCVGSDSRIAQWREKKESFLGEMKRWIWEWGAFQNRVTCAMFFLG